ncbi:hypothetical protein FQN50_000486 [Emmonsiellopsis sp. PD_5]|nr:hypothetical protein FQN50_000486 [Emmonsiellopsis sp. PD_5]
MLNMIPIHSPPLQPPLSCLINCLIDLDIVEEKTGNNTGHLLFPSHNVNANVDRLTHILYLATESYNVEEMDRYGSPLVQVLLHIAESAPLNPKTRLQVLLLPSRQDRAAALGSGDSLPARLLRLSTAPTCNLGDLILALLFELSDKDPKQFIRNISYGFAAGFLLSRGVQLPENALESWTAANVDNSNAGRNSGRFMVNPTTGQRLDMEPTVQVPEMTDEEKEREAERLFVLFERC